MIAADEDAVVCDFAETYHVFDYRALPLQTAATLACGLRDGSRIRAKLAGTTAGMDTLMLVQIRDALEKVGFQVVMTRDGDSSPSLLARPSLAYEERVDAFISVHHNSTAPQRDPRQARYTATYASLSNGLSLARCIQKHIGQVLAPVQNVGAQLKSLAVCRNPAVPSCLLEVDFINLPEGEEGSWDPMRQKKVADAVVCGVLDWMTPPPPVPPSEPVEEAPAAAIP